MRTDRQPVFAILRTHVKADSTARRRQCETLRLAGLETPMSGKYNPPPARNSHLYKKLCELAAYVVTTTFIYAEP